MWCFPNRKEAVLLLLLLFILEYFIDVNAHICEVGRERNQHNEWKWVLPYPDPCQCTKIIMGGMNTWTPIRPFVPIYVNSPLLSDEIKAIREHYGLTCKTETSSKVPESPASASSYGSPDLSFSTSDGSVSSASTSTDQDESVAKLSTRNEDAISSEISIGTKGASNIASKGGTTSSPSTTNSPESTSRGPLSSKVTLTTETAKGTTTSSSTSAATSLYSPFSTEAEAGIKSSPRNEETTAIVSISTITAHSATPKVCSDKLGMKNGDIPDANIQSSGYCNEYIFSVLVASYPPLEGRLNGDSIWAEDGKKVNPWIQADIGYQTYVSGVITQGDGSQIDLLWPDWVTTLKVSTFKVHIADEEEVFVKDDNGEVKIFRANTDRNTKVMSTFPKAVFARIVRITCLTMNAGGDQWNLRFEVVGCKRNNNDGGGGGGVGN